MSGGIGDPRDVLAAVRRMESELARVRASSGRPEDSVDDLRSQLATESANERRAVVEDMELLLDVMEAGWRRTHEELQAVTRQLADLRSSVIECQDVLAGARLEVRLGPVNGLREDAPM